MKLLTPTVSALEIAGDHVILELDCGADSDDNATAGDNGGKGGREYLLEWREDGTEEWTPVAGGKSIQSIVKKGTVPGSAYQCRARIMGEGGEPGPFSDVFSFQTPVEGPQKSILETFVVAEDKSNGESFAARVQWKASGNERIHELQMRTLYSGDKESRTWRSFSDKLTKSIVVKKNLASASDYAFRVRSGNKASQEGNADISWGPWSLIHYPVRTPELHASFKNLFVDGLLRVGDGMNLESCNVNVLAGKVVCIYFSASWCPPCRKRTEEMCQPTHYPSWKGDHLPFEIVLVSLDRNENSFRNYFSKMPWLAMPFGSRCSELKQIYQVKSIPRLMVFSRSGRIIAEDALQQPFDSNVIAQWARED